MAGPHDICQNRGYQCDIMRPATFRLDESFCLECKPAVPACLYGLVDGLSDVTRVYRGARKEVGSTFR